MIRSLPNYIVSNHDNSKIERFVAVYKTLPDEEKAEILDLLDEFCDKIKNMGMTGAIEFLVTLSEFLAKNEVKR